MKQFKQIDSLNFRLKRLSKLNAGAQGILKDAAAGKDKIALSFSGGKDSLACAILCKKMGITPELVWFNSGYEFPETRPFITSIANRLGFPLREIKPRVDPLQTKIAAGFFDLKAIAKVNPKILSPWWETNKEYDLVITGLRLQESRARRMNIGRNGTYFYNKTFGAYCCYPVARFQTRDIFAYIVGNNFSYHPIYDKAKTIEERDWIRVNWYILTAAERGFYVFLKRHYPLQFTLLNQKLPEIRCYV